MVVQARVIHKIFLCHCVGVGRMVQIDLHFDVLIMLRGGVSYYITGRKYIS